MKISNLLDDFKIGMKWTYARRPLFVHFILTVLACNAAVLFYIFFTLSKTPNITVITSSGGIFGFMNTMFFLIIVRSGRHAKDMQRIDALITLLEDATRGFADQYYPNYEGYFSFEEPVSRFQEDIPDEEF